jgi:hypothetical protein
VYGDISPEVRRPEPEAGYSSPSSADVKNHELYPTHCTILNYDRGKDKAVPVLNRALRHESAWGSARIDPRFLDLGTSWR